MQMRIASYFGKVIGHDLTTATAAQCSRPRQIGGARALVRDDLAAWRLEPGRTSSSSILAVATACATARP
jgi:hypothetical protein